ncbi:MAG: hypothetical protein DMD73_12380, partial [Gemmatimonadetes bacterium]
MGALTLDRRAATVASVPLRDALAELPSEWERLREHSLASPFAGWAWHQAWSGSAPEAELRACRTLVLRRA